MRSTGRREETGEDHVAVGHEVGRVLAIRIGGVDERLQLQKLPPNVLDVVQLGEGVVALALCVLRT